MALPHGAHGLGGAADRIFAELRGVGVAGGFIADAAQAETLRRVERGGFDPPVVEGHALGLRIFEEKLAVIHALERLGDDLLDPRLVHAGLRKEQIVGQREVGHIFPSRAGSCHVAGSGASVISDIPTYR